MADYTIGEWVVRVDREATLAAWNAAEDSTAQCSCAYCRNFMVARPSVYAGAPAELFDMLGISPPRETETYELGPEEGRVLYGGWTNFVGELVTVPTKAAEPSAWVAPNHLVTPTDDPRCYVIGFAPAGQLAPTSFEGAPVVQLEFLVRVPWFLPEPYPGGAV